MTFQLETVVQGESEDDKEVQDAVDLIKKSLNGKGLNEAVPGEAGDMEITVAYGVSGPREKITGARDTVEPGISSGGGFLNREAPNQRRGQDLKKANDGTLFTPAGKARNTQFSAETDMERGAGSTSTVYDKFVSLSCRTTMVDDSGKEQVIDLWRVVAKKVDGRKRIGSLLPILAATSAAFAGESTSGETEVRVKLDGRGFKLLGSSQ